MASDSTRSSDHEWFRRTWIVIARRELSSLTHEKTIIFAVLVQLFIAAFSSSFIIGLTSLYTPSTGDGNVVTIGVTGDAMDVLTAAAATQDGVDVMQFASREIALAEFTRGDIDAVLTSQVRRTDSGTIIDVVAIAPAERSRTSLVVIQIRQLLVEVERNERFERAAHLDFQPVTVPDSAPPAPHFEFTYTMLIPLLLFLPLFISGSVAADTITEEIERGTLELLQVAPVSLVDIIDGKAAAMIPLVPLQAGLWILLLSVNGIPVGDPVTLLLFITFLAITFVVIGLISGLYTGRRGQAQVLYTELVIILLGVAVVLPEHPVTTITKIAAKSPTTQTFTHVTGWAIFAVILYIVTRRLISQRGSKIFLK